MPDRAPDEFDQTIRSDAGSDDGLPPAPDEGATLRSDSSDPGGFSGDAPDFGATLVDGPRGGEVVSIEQRFEMLGELGAGGMSVVYKAKDRRLGRQVALKRLKGQTGEDRQTIDRFWREARSIAALDHFNIVRIYNVFEDEGRLWIEMELLEGGTLQDLIDREGALPAERVVELGVQMCDALSLSHARGIIHRDIKPANILLTERGTPKLADFGLAQERVADASYTVTGALLGTMHYAAPEQLVSGKHVDERSDIYALGATLYAIASGLSPRMVRLDLVPPGLRDIIGKCLEENPASRYESMESLGTALREAAGSPGPAGGEKADTSCPKCGWQNPSDVRWCQKCGENLSSLFKACPKCQRENRIDTEYCGGCGENIASFEQATRAIVQAESLLKRREFESALKVLKDAMSHGSRLEDLKKKLNEALLLKEQSRYRTTSLGRRWWCVLARRR